MWPFSKPTQPEPDAPPDGVRLASYLDGELSPAEAARVEAWLESHPEGRAAIEADRKLDQLLVQAFPPEPGAAAWNRVFARVEQAVATTPAGRRKLSWLARAGGGMAAAAALLLLAWGLHEYLGTDPGDIDLTSAEVLPVVSEGEVRIDEMDPLFAGAVVVGRLPAMAVAGSDDVVIISMDAGDTKALVVGTPPIDGPLVLAGPDEVKLDSMANSGDAQKPYWHTSPGAGPIIMWPRIGKD